MWGKSVVTRRNGDTAFAQGIDISGTEYGNIRSATELTLSHL